MGGSPCTHWSIAQTKNRETAAEGVGWELFKNYLIALEKYKPDYFLYENNKSMSAAIRGQITKELGVEPIMINSALVSAQSRQRLYWTNIPGVEQPVDRGILLRDILESGVHWREKAYTLRTPAGTKQGICVLAEPIMAAEPLNPLDSGKSRAVTANYHKKSCGPASLALDAFPDRPEKQVFDFVAAPIRIGTIESDAKNADYDSQPYRVYSPDGKAVTLCGQGGGVGAKTGLYATPIRIGDMPNADGEISGSQSGRIHSIDGKSVPLQARPNGDWQHNKFVIESADGKTWPMYAVKDGQITIKGKQYPIKLADGFYIIRKLTVTECKRLQTVPEEYTFPVSDTQAYKMLGNGWTVDVIAHILGYVPGIKAEPLEVFSMYDGMSCSHIALDQLGCNVAKYYATEIDKYAIQTTQYNYPKTIQLGDAFQVCEDDWCLPD